MAVCTPLTYTSVTSAQWACLQAAFQKAGIDVSSADSGSVTVSLNWAGGATLAWDYASATSVLTLTWTQGSLEMPCTQLNSGLTSIINESGCLKPPPLGKCPSIVYRGVSTEAWACLQAAFQSQGIDVAGDSGHVPMMDNQASLSWDYSPPWIRSMVTFQCDRLGKDVPACADLNAQIQNIVTESGCIPKRP
jgi:hypothetical protein